jgi:hypothetical protein
MRRLDNHADAARLEDLVDGLGASSGLRSSFRSAAARSVTGRMLAVDGGQHLVWKTPHVLAAAE